MYTIIGLAIFIGIILAGFVFSPFRDPEDFAPGDIPQTTISSEGASEEDLDNVDLDALDRELDAIDLDSADF